MPEQASRRVDRGAAEDLDAYSIQEFCRRHSISQALFFKLKAKGEAPRTIAVGARRLITKEAAKRGVGGALRSLPQPEKQNTPWRDAGGTRDGNAQSGETRAARL